MLGYDELRIRVRKVGTRRYLVLANGPACAAEVVVLDRDPAEYRRTFERLISMELGTEPTGGRPVVPQLRQLGREVFALLFPDAVARCLAESRARVSARPDRALRLRFDLPPDEPVCLVVELVWSNRSADGSWMSGTRILGLIDPHASW